MNKKDDEIQIDLQELLDQDLFNRYFLYKHVNYDFGKAYGLKLVGLVFFLLLKLGASRCVRKANIYGKQIFISWSSLHTGRSKDLAEEFELVEFNRLSFAKKQLAFFSRISITEFFKNFSRIKKSELTNVQKASNYVNNTFIYRFLFVIEFMVLKEIIGAKEKIFMAGYNDRTSLIISKICEKNNIHLSILQHGVLGRKENWKPLKANRFFYLYLFSKEYISCQIEVNSSTELILLPKRTSSLNLGTFQNGKFKKNIAYATSPADSGKDILLLNQLKKDLFEKEYNLLIYPHPLEKESTYKGLKNDESVFLTRKRHKNVSYLISRYSTLGIDYYEAGIIPVFLNFDKQDSDFLNSKEFIVFEDLPSFRIWIKHSL